MASLPGTSAPVPAPSSGRWLAALSGDADVAATALFELARAYRYPAYAFLRASGLDAETAAQRVESLLARLVEDGRVCEEAVSFRACLLRLSRAALTQPEARAAVIELDRGVAEARFIKEPARPAEELYQRRWALTAVERALLALEQEYAGEGRGALHDALRPFLVYAPVAASCRARSASSRRSRRALPPRPAAPRASSTLTSSRCGISGRRVKATFSSSRMRWKARPSPSCWRAGDCRCRRRLRCSAKSARRSPMPTEKAQPTATCVRPRSSSIGAAG